MAQQVWKQGTFSCLDDMETCCCGWWCGPCQVYSSAEDLGKSGLLYGLIYCCLFPCIPIYLLRDQARERYGIEGSTADDALCSFCCGACVSCQTAAEIKHRGDNRKS